LHIFDSKRNRDLLNGCHKSQKEGLLQYKSEFR